MTWVRIDDDFARHPKVLKAGVHAIGLHVLALTWCSKYLTNGHVSEDFVLQTSGKQAKRLVEKLLNAGLWSEADTGGWVIHDYLSYNLPREQVLAKREKDRGRKAQTK